MSYVVPTSTAKAVYVVNDTITIDTISGAIESRQYVWDTVSLAWVKSEVTNGAVAATINNFPSIYPVSDNGGSLTIDSPQLPAALTGSGNFKVSLNESNVTQAVSVASLPLPAGAATESTLATLNGKITVVSTRVLVDGSGVTQPISAVSLPLPTGAATESTLSALNSKVSLSGSNILVDGSTVTQPISASSLPLPTGASTEATLSALNTKVTTTVNGIKVDGSSVTQPVSGTITTNQGGSWSVAINNAAGASAVNIQDGGNSITVDGSVSVSNFPATQAISAVSLPLPTGAATQATLATLLLDATFTGRINTLGQKTSANSTPIVIASDQTVIPISDNGGSITVDGSVSISNFPATQAVTQSGTWTVQPGNTANTTPWLATISQGGNSATVSAAGALKVDGSAVTQPVSIAATVGVNLAQINGVTGLAGNGVTGTGSQRVTIASDNTAFSVNAVQSGTWATRIQDSSGTSITLGQKTGANSVPVVIASDQDRSSTVTHSNIAGSASAVTLQAANTARLGWSVYNDSNRDWYVRWGASASTTNFDVLVIPNAYLEIPFKYVGIITGIQTVANGNARVAEFT